MISQTTHIPGFSIIYHTCRHYGFLLKPSKVTIILNYLSLGAFDELLK